jgi:hypothetical protein
MGSGAAVIGFLSSVEIGLAVLLLLAAAELVEDAPACLVEEEGFEGAEAGVELLLLQVLRHTDEGFLHHIARLVIAEPRLAGDVEDKAGVGAVEFIPRGPVVPVVEFLDEGFPRGRGTAFLQLLEDLLFVGNFRVVSHGACLRAPDKGRW